MSAHSFTSFSRSRYLICFRLNLETTTTRLCMRLCCLAFKRGTSLLVLFSLCSWSITEDFESEASKVNWKGVNKCMYILLAWLHCSGGFYITTRSIIATWWTGLRLITGTEPFTLLFQTTKKIGKKEKKKKTTWSMILPFEKLINLWWEGRKRK